jgi:hypothetical protein
MFRQQGKNYFTESQNCFKTNWSLLQIFTKVFRKEKEKENRKRIEGSGAESSPRPKAAHGQFSPFPETLPSPSLLGR